MTLYHVRQYRKFPYKQEDDPVRYVYKNWTEATEKSKALNRASDFERYYAIDFPHEIIELTNQQREELFTRFGLE